MDEQELRKLAEWAGFKQVESRGLGILDGGFSTHKVWSYPNLGGEHDDLPDFPQSLDACFKWLVPKYIAEVCLLPMGLTSIMSIYAFLFAEWLKVMNNKVEPALALCLAIEKLIGEDKNG